MSLLLLVHGRLLTTVLLFFGALAIWGIASGLGGREVSGSYSGALVIGELLMITQSLIGLGLLFGQQPARLSLHILYGVVAVIVLPGTAAFLRGRRSRLASLMYGLACLFLCGIALRTQVTGQL